ncbi:hypothetical protein GKC56_06620 [Neisseriaceae bacterium PsAf]|nr:hypothetical protein [Neisseriaceae bacterium PsAf]MCV2503045.1 sel1 repeat family protein [Neisseriaceae bacterium]
MKKTTLLAVMSFLCLVICACNTISNDKSSRINSLNQAILYTFSDNLTQSNILTQKAIDEGSLTALALKEYQQKNYPNAEKILDQAILKDQNSDALFLKGMLYLTDAGIRKDAPKAKKLFEKSIEKDNNSMALTYLGLMYQVGEDVTKDTLKAKELYEKAITKDNNPIAIVSLGTIYYYGGNGIPPNQQRAIELFELAAQQDNLSALSWLMSLQQNNSALKNNVDYQHLYNEKACEQGYETKCYLK